MKYSQSLIKTYKETPSDADSINASYLERAGFVQKQMAGVYALLPLGYRVYKKIENIVREEMNAIDGQEILMNVLQPKELWEETNRWQEMKDIFYALKDSRDKDLGLGPSHEEQITSIIREKFNSYKNLPQALYQIQTKFRNEPRAKSGLLRGREFIMKDLYSFHSDEESLDNYYKRVIEAYFKIFKRLGLETKLVEASGGPFTSKYSHEFQVIAPGGEDTIYFCDKCDFAQNQEIAKVKEGDKCPKCEGKIERANSIEVGNIFKPGAKYSELMGAKFTDENGASKDILMGCYGIGLTRCLATIIEIKYNIEKDVLEWPDSVAPFKAYLIDLTDGEAGKIYKKLLDAGIEVLYDDRNVSAGVKFSDADLLGIPYRIVVSKKTLAEAKVEIKERSSEKSSLDTVDKIVENLRK